MGGLVLVAVVLPITCPYLFSEDNGGSPEIPQYVENIEESTRLVKGRVRGLDLVSRCCTLRSVKRARLLYQSRKRGILENGLLLSSFADKHLHGFNKVKKPADTEGIQM